MALPTPRPLPTGSVEVYGQAVEYRALSRSEALRLHTAFSKEQADEAEVWILSRGASVTEDEARAWLAGADVDEGRTIVDAILTLTGLGDDEDPKGKSA